MNIKDIIKERRTIRAFDEKEVPKEVILDIIDAGSWAPSACNKQRWEFVIIEDKEVKKRLIKEANFTYLKKIPTAVYVLYDSEVNPEKKANFQSAGAAIQNMLLYAHSLDVGSWWIAAYGDEKETRKILNIPENLAIIAAIGFGHPSSRPLPPPRRPIKEQVHFNKFAGEAVSSKKQWTLEETIEFCGLSIYAKSPTIAHREYFEREYRQKIESINKELAQENLIIFDIPGNHLFDMARENPNKQFVDYIPSKEILRWHKERAGHLELDNITFNEKLPERKFDCVLCMEAVNKVSDEDEIIDVAKEMTKPSGTLLISIINRLSFQGIYAPQSLRLFGPEITKTQGKVKKAIKRAGFKIDRVTGLNLLPSKKILSSSAGFSGEERLKKLEFLVSLLSLGGRTEAFTTNTILRNFCRVLLYKCKK
jgi:nitroreductase/SAM-dependent methyltransferase